MAGGLREALEAALDDDPNDRASWMAYADHFAEQGDPRGELMQVHLALEDAASSPGLPLAGLLHREMELLERHRQDWLVGLADPGLVAVADRRWARGGLDELCLTSFNLSAAEALLRCPAARFLRKLDLRDNYVYLDDEEPEDGERPFFAPEGEDYSALYLLHLAPFRPHLRFLRVGEPVDVEKGQYNSHHCSARGLVGMLERTPRLEELHVLAKDPDLKRLFALRLPRLRRLLLYHEDGIHPLRVLANNPGMPALESLSIHPAYATGSSYLPLAEVTALLRSPHFPALRELHLHASELGDEGCTEIVASGILKRLRVLDLRHGCVGDAGARALADCPDVRRLDLLNLADNEIGQEGAAILNGLGIAVRLDRQHHPSSHAYLYSGDVE